MEPRAWIALACWALASIGPAEAQDDPAKSWQGHYRYVYDGGTTAGGSNVTVTHDLLVGPSGARGGCLLASSGYQTDERLVCHVSGDETRLTVAFHRYEDGRLVNRYGVAVYKPGQTLFTLSRPDASADAAPTTAWDGFRPGGEGESRPGAFFQRVP